MKVKMEEMVEEIKHLRNAISTKHEERADETKKKSCSKLEVADPEGDCDGEMVAKKNIKKTPPADEPAQSLSSTDT